MLACISCTQTFSDLATTRIDYKGNQMAINGYYYSFSKTKVGKPFGDIILFYTNGIFLYLGSPEVNTIEELDKYILWSNSVGAPNYRQGWGVFQIEASQIKIERWLENSNGKIPVMTFNGQILNDTTFRMGLFKEVQDWKFRSFSPKPDSSNAKIFIK